MNIIIDLLILIGIIILGSILILTSVVSVSLIAIFIKGASDVINTEDVEKGDKQ
nr:MAG TPA: hypothetical protein [Caudoviricetes sp.]